MNTQSDAEERSWRPPGKMLGRSCWSKCASASARVGWPSHVIEDTGHVPHVEKTDAFTRHAALGTGMTEER